MEEMNRRELLTRAGTVGAVVGLGLAGAGAATAASHGDHSDHSAGGDSGKQDAKLAELVDEALDCKEAGLACVRHCVASLGKGDTSLAACLDQVLRMKSVVDATAEVASLDLMASARTKELVKLCAAVCRDCREECEKHAKHHGACRECMEACDECIEACEAVLAA